ncbi:MAG: type II toxin-antitoxin system Phd/YefM family antitoxin [Anaerolineae bacterium]|nr:type II toxin-antitoxin system Phd/YefM family antitoxin [Anaerolineae bacterium]
MDTVSVRDARKQFTDLINRVYYGQAQVRITRHGKTLVRLVSEDQMQAIDELIESDPKLRRVLVPRLKV